MCICRARIMGYYTGPVLYGDVMYIQLGRMRGTFAPPGLLLALALKLLQLTTMVLYSTTIPPYILNQYNLSLLTTSSSLESLATVEHSPFHKSPVQNDNCVRSTCGIYNHTKCPDVNHIHKRMYMHTYICTYKYTLTMLNVNTKSSLN